MKEAILKGDFDGFAKCMYDGWLAKKKTSDSISNAYIDDVFDFVMQHGGKAGKISGAGGGGFMMIFCDPTRRFELAKMLREKGEVMLPSFVEYGAQAWTLY
jgi:D-glycero-alpha-D-manno-heptose-7-phosphate kinase